MNIYGLGGIYSLNAGLGYSILGLNAGLGYNSLGYINNTNLSGMTGIQRTGLAGAAENIGTKYTTSPNLLGHTYYPSFQSVLAASIKGQDLEELLAAQYPGIKYQVMDTSKIDTSLWQRNDYPFERFFDDKADTSVLDWKPASQEPSMTDAKVQAKLNAARGKYAVIVPPGLEEKLDGNTELAQSILCRISTLAMQQDTIPRTIDSFTIALDEEGNIANYRFSGGGGQLTLPYSTVLQRTAVQKTGRTQSQRQEQQHHL